MSFYDEIAGEYGSIVDQAARREAARRFVTELTARYNVASALDMACGTGLYAHALAEAGIATTAGDLSQAMLDQAQRGAPAGIRWHCGPMQALADELAGPFDAIVCMGNSLPHLLTDADLSATLAGAYALLADGGVLAIHLLNYDRILAEGERIVGVTRSEDVEYIRFYDFLADQVRFNLLTIRWHAGQASHELHSTLLRPYRAEQLQDALLASGFTQVDVLDGLNSDSPGRESSDTILLIARKAIDR